MDTQILEFLKKHRFQVQLDVTAASELLLADMRSGLAGKHSDEDMNRTWMNVPDKEPQNENVIVIDAGGTNFRSCLVSFDTSGTPIISDFRKCSMPGIEKELSKEEFFGQIADNISYLKGKADRIGFCFSYSMEITKDGDGIARAFSKGIKAPEVAGTHIGAELRAVLEKRGWTVSHIRLMNDTVAALLAGAAGTADNSPRFSSYIGFILGTGMNAAYIQPEITGSGSTVRSVPRQIIVCENGKFSGAERSDFDVTLDKSTAQPGTYLLEKCCSGAYLGPLVLAVLKSAAQEGLFSPSCAEAILSVRSLSTIEIDNFLHNPYENPCSAPLPAGAQHPASWCAAETDRERLFFAADAVIDRAARYAASILTACLVQCGEGRNPCRPVAILFNGTTLFKTCHLKSRIEAYLHEAAAVRRGLYYEIISKENDITLGTAVGGLV